MFNPKATLLPVGYDFTDQETVTSSEVIELRNAGGWSTVKNTDRWKKVLEQSLAVVGVRSESGSLIGIGFMAGNVRHAVLCDLIVHPAHRGRGIGVAILQKRIIIADKMGIVYLYTNLVPTNSLTDTYVALGFTASAKTYVRTAYLLNQD